jgi:hypothetical protein
MFQQSLPVVQHSSGGLQEKRPGRGSLTALRD